jgi:hypothetical protein
VVQLGGGESKNLRLFSPSLNEQEGRDQHDFHAFFLARATPKAAAPPQVAQVASKHEPHASG